MSKKTLCCKACNNEISSKAKVCPNCGAKLKKPVYKRWWFWAIIVFVLIAIISGGGDDTNTETGENTTVTEELPYNETKLIFTIVAGEEGDYGKMVTYNQGTEFEENFYAYYVPVGTYTVTNKGEYRTQINVYSDKKIINEDGWEEPESIGTVEVLDVNQSVVITVENGQHIEASEPSVFEFVQETLTGSNISENQNDKIKNPTTEKGKETKPTVQKTTVAKTESKETMGQKNARKKAESYLDFSAFSRESLIEQLEFEGFSNEDAVYAVDNVDVDWNEQALEKAKSYLDFSAFSEEGLIEQLEFEGFTSSEAKYGVYNCGADWNEQAAKKAESYLEFSSFSRDGLIDQLEFEGFTHEQAVYGVEAVGY